MLWNKMLETASTGRIYFGHPGGGRFTRIVSHHGTTARSILLHNNSFLMRHSENYYNAKYVFSANSPIQEQLREG